MTTVKFLLPTLIAIHLSSSLSYADKPSIDSIGVNIGYSKMVENFSTTGSIKNLEPNNNFTSAEIYMMLRDVFPDSTYRPTLNYIYSTNSNLTNQSLLIGLNKYFIRKNSSLYLGLLAGYGELKWDKSYIDSTLKNDLIANSIVYGAQVGLDAPVSEHISLNINVKYLLHDYTMDVEYTPTNTASYDHKSTTNISVGLKYSFYVNHNIAGENNEK